VTIRLDSVPPIDVESFQSALNTGALDACLVLLRQCPRLGLAEAELYCQLGAALLPRERRDDAIACCRTAFDLVQHDASLLHLCAWVFSNSGCFDEAAAAYLRLVALEPEWSEGYRHASGMLAAAGRWDEALTAALDASDAAPGHVEFAIHAARLLAAAGYEHDAGLRIDQAIGVSDSEPQRIVDAAELLMQIGRGDDAAELLAQAALDGSAEPRLYRVLSSAEMLCERWDAAVAAIDGAIAAAPDIAEYHLHRAHLLRHAGDIEGAAQALAHAASLDPANGDTKRAQLSLYLGAGLATEATIVGGELLHGFPNDRRAAESVLHLLNYRLDTIDGEFVVLPGGGERQRRAARPPPGWTERLQTQIRVIGALIIRETRTRFGESKLGYGWALIEPVLHISLLSATFAVLMHGQPPIGSHFFLFYYTGLIPYHVFVHASGGMSHAIIGNAPLLQLPVVTKFDVIAARGLLEVATDIVVAVLLLIVFGAIGIGAMPDDLLGPSLALLVTAALGCGVGFVNAVMTTFFRSWETAFGHVTRLLYFISGIFYMPEQQGFLRCFPLQVSP